MRRQGWGIAVAAVLAGVWLTQVAQGDAKAVAGEEFVGTWSGTWEGGGAGRFDLTIERGGAGQMTGGVSVGTDQGDYTAKFTELSFDGNKMKAKYDFPLEARADIVIEGAFAAEAADGSWTMVPDGDSSALAAGSWKVSRK
jgi:hypothetical protein